MDLGADKLLVLVQAVQARPALYDYTMKEYSRKDVIDQLWDEIAREMNVTGSDCRLKWHNLRCSYSRYLRGIKKQTRGSATNKRKKWYLADSMSFLQNYINNKQTTSQMKCVEDSEESEESELLTSCIEIYEDSNPCHSESHSGLFKPSSTDKQWEQSPTEFLAAPMTNSLDRLPESQLKERESPLVSFFRGLLPDIEKLAPKRQRTFKMELVQLVNKLVDEEEEHLQKSSRT